MDAFLLIIPVLFIAVMGVVGAWMSKDGMYD